MIGSEELEREILSRLERELRKEELLSQVPSLQGVVESYLRRGAKLLRPMLLLEAASAYATETPISTEPLYELAAATELLHVFALMHDDRIDASGRPGVPAAETPGKLPFLVLAGDLLHTIAVEMIHDAVKSWNLSPAIPGWVRTVSVRTIAGQALELSRFGDSASLPDVDALFRLYDLKTGYYSFVAPLIIGALAARDERDAGNLTEADLPMLEEIGLLLGRAFQLKDDAEDTARLARETNGVDLPPWELGLLLTYLAREGKEEVARRILRENQNRRATLGGLSLEPLTAWASHTAGSLIAEAEEIARRLSIFRGARLVERTASIAELR
ncbi:MAG: polyprenyl synthetase family protein [Spirochaetaceae bacterium]